MADDDKEQKTEQATEKRRTETREKGRFVQSKEVASAGIIMAIIFSLYFFGTYMLDRLMGFTRTTISQVGLYELNADNAVLIFYGMIKTGFITVAPLAVVVMIAAVTIEIMQGGGIVLALEPITPKLSKINPLEGIKRIFSLNSFVELIKSIFKIAIVGYIAYKTVSSEFSLLPSLMEQENPQILQYVSWVSLKIIFFTLLAMIVLAALDYSYQRYSFEESIKMTKQEVKDERKDTEGDPRVKARIRSVQLEVARRRMMEAVPTADVVITNPTHLAVAIKYERDRMIAPEVVAKGAGFMAERIKNLAKEAGVPLVEDKPLARMLYKTVKIGEGVPIELYKTVAEILAYVYRLKGKRET